MNTELVGTLAKRRVLFRLGGERIVVRDSVHRSGAPSGIRYFTSKVGRTKARSPVHITGKRRGSLNLERLGIHEEDTPSHYTSCRN